MNRLLFLVATGALLIACNQKGDEPPPSAGGKARPEAPPAPPDPPEPQDEPAQSLADWSYTTQWGEAISDEQLDETDPAWKGRRDKCVAAVTAQDRTLEGFELVNIKTDAKGVYFLYFTKRSRPTPRRSTRAATWPAASPIPMARC